MGKPWKKGRGKLGFMDPLLGRWVAEAESPMGPLRCTRAFEPVLDGAYVKLEARWELLAPAGRGAKAAAGGGVKKRHPYEELALIGAGDDGKVAFWSYTSDGKRSLGTLSDVRDLHRDAIGFEAQMPAGFARMGYWPDGEDGFFWVVESRTKKGWNRFVHHRYRPA